MIVMMIMMFDCNDVDNDNDGDDDDNDVEFFEMSKVIISNSVTI